jgi:hypothetical protein
MSNPILSSNQSSAVVATINESTTKNPWVYNETDRLVSPHAMQILNVTKSSGTVAPKKTFAFDLPKNGIVQGIWLNFELPGLQAANLTETHSAGEPEDQSGVLMPSANNKRGFSALGLLSLISEIKLTTSGRIIESLDKWQILSRIADMPLGVRSSMQEAFRMAGDPATSTYRACLFIPFYLCKSAERYSIASNFEEPHRVEVTLSDCQIFSHGDDTAPSVFQIVTPTECDMLVHYRQLDEMQMNEVIQKNYGDGLLSRVVHISKTEALTSGKSLNSTNSLTTLPSTSAFEITLKENEAIRAMYVVVECPVLPDEDKVTYAEHLKEGAPLEIVNFALKFNNTTVLDVPGEFVRHYGRWGNHGLNGDGADGALSLSQMRYVYKLDFGLDYQHAPLSNVVALREISNPTLTIRYKPAAKDTLHQVHICYETATFLSCSSSTGRVQLSISS